MKEILELKNKKCPIVVDSLSKKYRNDCVALNDISFLVKEGQTMALLGSNGAGKSTTLGILAALIARTSGTVQFHGVKVSRTDSIFRSVGVCPQFDTFYPELTIYDHLQFFAGLKGLSSQDRYKVIEFYLNHLQLE